MPSSWRTWNRSWICIQNPTIQIVPSCAWTSKPVQLVKEARPPMAATKKRPRRVDYEYERAGTASVFLFSSPPGRRRTRVFMKQDIV